VCEVAEMCRVTYRYLANEISVFAIVQFPTELTIEKKH